MHRFTDSSFNCYCQLLRISINSITMDEHHVFVIKHQLLTEAITHKRRISRRGRSICCVPHISMGTICTLYFYQTNHVNYTEQLEKRNHVSLPVSFSFNTFYPIYLVPAIALFFIYKNSEFSFCYNGLCHVNFTTDGN